jgi:H+/Cl- antiporter ClcA
VKNFLDTLDKTKIKYIAKGVLVGTLAGVVVSLFRLAIEKIGEMLPYIYHQLKIHPLWLIPWSLLMILLAVVVGYLIKSEPNIKGSGIPQVEGQLKDDITISWWSVLWKKFVGGILSVGMGLFLGREGPSIQLGASCAQGIAIKMKASKSEEKILLSSGAAAGLAAAFNAPVAGLLFVVEEVHHNFSPLVWLTSFAAALMSNFVSLTFFGLQPVLHLGDIPSLPLKYYWLLILLGILLGVLGRFYQIILLALDKWYTYLPLPSYFRGILPFIFVIPVGLFFPHSLGGGNQIILALGQHSPTLIALLGLLGLRFAFSMISYGSGLPGGIFLPILTLGAVIGSLFANLAVTVFGLEPFFVKDFIVIAMAGYFAAIGKAPLTAIILVTEMVGSLVHLMPLGLTALVAYIVVDILGGDPIYESLLERLVKSKKTHLTGQRTTVEIPVLSGSKLDGTLVRDFEWPDHMLLALLHRGDREILPHGDTVMKIGDTLEILTDTTHASAIIRRIKEQM